MVLELISVTFFDWGDMFLNERSGWWPPQSTASSAGPFSTSSIRKESVGKAKQKLSRPHHQEHCLQATGVIGH